eukprot:5408171-Pleurochrysis_carterae.AAC.2
MQARCFFVGLAKLAQKSAQVSSFFSSLRCRYDLGFAGGKSHGRLFLAAPGDGSPAVHEYMSGGGMTRCPVGVGEARHGERISARVT